LSRDYIKTFWGRGRVGMKTVKHSKYSSSVIK
jgi:hypothetical protein